jgi:hypothetical protein
LPIWGPEKDDYSLHPPLVASSSQSDAAGVGAKRNLSTAITAAVAEEKKNVSAVSFYAGIVYVLGFADVFGVGECW